MTDALRSMSPAAGEKPGPYEIVAPIDARGMGEVYRARDRGPRGPGTVCVGRQRMFRQLDLNSGTLDESSWISSRR